MGFPISTLVAVLFVAALFTVKFYLARQKIERKLYNSPSVVFLGAGENAIKHISGRVSRHNDMHYAHHSKGILVAAHHSKVKKMNAKKLVYVFNADRPVRSQVKSFRGHQKTFGKLAAVAFGDNKKISALRRDVGKLHNLSSEEGTDRLKELIDSALSS